MAQVFVEARNRGYKRSFGSMCKQIRNRIKLAKNTRSKVRSSWRPTVVTYPGEKVQIDIKYVPKECLKFDTKGISYYQITAIDEYSRKRVLEIVDEKSMTHTARFLMTLEKHMGFKIKTVQTDNGKEFTNLDRGAKKSLFELVLEKLKIQYIRIRPFSPWQNGKVERSHRVDGKRFYSREFNSLGAFKKAHRRYNARYNNIAQCVLSFKSPNEIVEEYVSSLSGACVTNV